MLGGGLTRGTSTLLLGPSGVGKTTTAVHCMHAALKRGERATYYLFDEGMSTLLLRSRTLGMDIEPFVDERRVPRRPDRPGRAVARRIRLAASSTRSTRAASSFVAIDSLNAYLQAMPGQSFLLLHMHELLTFLNHRARHDHADRRPARQPSATCAPRSTSATSPTRR